MNADSDESRGGVFTPPESDDSGPDGAINPGAASGLALAAAPIGAESHSFRGCVVGIGASAGGLDALERFFGALPANTGAAFVVIQHLSPDHKSMMDNLLSRYTGMPVRVAEHGQTLEPNAVFLIPPSKNMRVDQEHLQLSPKAPHGLSLPIDIFFASLAEQCADRAVAIVLSGTGSDGSRGVPAVNAAGGFVFVQEPASAKFDGMPRSAIATGLVDVVAPVEELAQRLVAHLASPPGPSLRHLGTEAVSALTQPLDAVLELLTASSGIDFREYKPTTVLRRIERRMSVCRANSLVAYYQKLAGSPEEQALLRREMLIPVTRFFRDDEVFQQLFEQVVLELVKREGSAEPIRVWVACCATGEEAYSIAILFHEAFRRLGCMRMVKIFATDVEPLYLEAAGAGLYPSTIAAEVSGERLEQYFVERDGGWLIRPEIRQMVIFARHNLVADSPFTRMDLVTCRNALIYFQPAAQERALRRLEYALLPGGHLLLGPSESLGVLHRDFAASAGRYKIYRLLRRDRLALHLDPPAQMQAHSQRMALRRRAAVHDEMPEAVNTWAALGQRQIMLSYAPPTLLIGAAGELMHAYGPVKELLHLGEGYATLDVLKLLPRELSWPAGLLLQSVAAERKAKSSAVVRLGEGERARRVRMVARPLDGPADTGVASAAGNLVLLSFEFVPDEPATPIELTTFDVEQRRRVETLERELDLTHESLQATIEELETANEELQATNEELMASNEELQSTNEELQSVNEELYTVNSEYQEKVDVLNSVNADLENVAKATAIPILFVDDALRLLRFTPEVMQLIKLRESDRGRSIEDFAHLLDYPELFGDLRRTIATAVATEREVMGRDGQWWLARIQPYTTRMSEANKAVVSFVNVSHLKDTQRMQAILDSLVEHVAVLDRQGTITRVNAAWRRFATENGDPALEHCGTGSNYLQVCARAARTDEAAKAVLDGLTDVLDGRLTAFTHRYPCQTLQGARQFLMYVAPVAHAGGGAVVSHIDVTHWAEPGDVAPALAAMQE